MFGVQARVVVVGVDGGGVGSFSYFTGGGPTVKHSKFDHLSPGSSPGGCTA